MTVVLREANRNDIPGMWTVRYAVTENTLTPGRLSDEDVRREIEDTGKGWVIEIDGRIGAFASCNAVTGNIWALFVHPDVEGRGYASRLHDAMLDWLGTQPVDRLWLTTDALSRACGFYERRGWQRVGVADTGEVRFERVNGR
jgi:GNAT superfamily N-acetyltransferase